MRKLLATLSVASLLAPIAVSAATAEELAAQIQALLNQVNALQAQNVGSATPTPGTGTLQCPHVSRVLKRGATGADVTRLQQFLALDPAIYPEAQITGYYGALTENAVKRFQCKNKLVCDGTPESTGYGVTGPRTAALLALQCPNLSGTNTASPSGFIRVTPTSGRAPLTVQVQATLNTGRSCGAQTYEIHFGTSAQPVIITVPANSCNEVTQTLTHTYSAAGTYSVSLRSGLHQNAVTVVVTGASSGSGNQGGPFSVTAGANGDPMQAIAQFDLASSCSRYQLDWGDGSSRNTQSEGSCASGAVSKSISHTYQNGGTYTLTLKRGSSLDIIDTIALTIVN